MLEEVDLLMSNHVFHSSNQAALIVDRESRLMQKHRSEVDSGLRKGVEWDLAQQVNVTVALLK